MLFRHRSLWDQSKEKPERVSNATALPLKDSPPQALGILFLLLKVHFCLGGNSTGQLGRVQNLMERLARLRKTVSFLSGPPGSVFGELCLFK